MLFQRGAQFVILHGYGARMTSVSVSQRPWRVNDERCRCCVQPNCSERAVFTLPRKAYRAASPAGRWRLLLRCSRRTDIELGTHRTTASMFRQARVARPRARGEERPEAVETLILLNL